MPYVGLSISVRSNIRLAEWGVWRMGWIVSLIGQFRVLLFRVRQAHRIHFFILGQ